jgi:hypothetical protein
MKANDYIVYGLAAVGVGAICLVAGAVGGIIGKVALLVGIVSTSYGTVQYLTQKT